MQLLQSHYFSTVCGSMLDENEHAATDLGAHILAKFEEASMFFMLTKPPLAGARLMMKGDDDHHDDSTRGDDGDHEDNNEDDNIDSDYNNRSLRGLPNLRKCLFPAGYWQHRVRPRHFSSFVHRS